MCWWWLGMPKIKWRNSSYLTYGEICGWCSGGLRLKHDVLQYAGLVRSFKAPTVEEKFGLLCAWVHKLWHSMRCLSAAELLTNCFFSGIMIFILHICQMKLMSSSDSQLESIYSCEEMVHVVGAVVVGQWAPTSKWGEIYYTPHFYWLDRLVNVFIVEPQNLPMLVDGTLSNSREEAIRYYCLRAPLEKFKLFPFYVVMVFPECYHFFRFLLFGYKLRWINCSE